MAWRCDFRYSRFYSVTRPNRQITSHLGDISKASSFAGFSDKQFDFVSCTHTLEDIRDPFVPLSEMQRIAKAGFIAVPNRHTELSNLLKFSPFGSWTSIGGHHLGFAHHRWIFHIRSAEKLEAVSKWSGIAGTQNLYESIIKKISLLSFLNVRKQRLLSRLGVRHHGDYAWIEPNLVGLPDIAELSIIWVDDIDFSFLNDDYAGVDYAAMFENLHEFVSAPIVSSPFSISEAVHELTIALL